MSRFKSRGNIRIHRNALDNNPEQGAAPEIWHQSPPPSEDENDGKGKQAICYGPPPPLEDKKYGKGLAICHRPPSPQEDENDGNSLSCGLILDVVLD